MGTIWKFVNKTTGKEMDCDDMKFLLQQLRTVKGLDLPEHIDIDLILKGRVEITVADEDGEMNEIIIGEHSPERGIYFRLNPVMS